MNAASLRSAPVVGARQAPRIAKGCQVMIVEMCDGISRCVDAHASSPRTSETGKSSDTRHALLRSCRHARLRYFRVVPQVRMSNSWLEHRGRAVAVLRLPSAHSFRQRRCR